MNDYSKHQELQALTLGKRTDYLSEYDPDLLQAVPRRLNREELGIVECQPFVGCDVWNAYEVSWLNAKGKPIAALARFTVDASSPNIIESKSFKLYLNSFNQTRFNSHEIVTQVMIDDLSDVAGIEVGVELFAADQLAEFQLTVLPGQCIDDLDIEVDQFELDPTLLCLDESKQMTDEVLHSHLLKSNCLITNQPDWASVIIRYQGDQINHESLLRYLLSFRMHNEFHEQCVERIFTDIQQYCDPQKLSVQALYTRRGGLDINPYRTMHETEEMPNFRINRQ